MKYKVYLKDLKNILPLLINIYLFFFGCCWVFFHVYIRFILERTPYTFLDLRTHITFLQYILFSCFVFLHLIILIYNIYIIYIKQLLNIKKSIFSQMMKLLTTILETVYWKPLEFIHDKVAPYIPGSGRFFLYLETKWKTIGFTYLMIFFFDIFPKVLLAAIFALETIIRAKIEVFFQLLPLIFIPVLFKILLKSFSSFAIRNKSNFTEAYESIKFLDPIYNAEGLIEKYTRYEFTVKDEYIGQADTKEDLRCLLILDHMQNIVIYCKELLSFMTPYITVSTSLLYIIGGLYRLIMLIQ